MQHKRRINQLSTVQDPQKVKILILTDQKTISSDFFFISRFHNIVKLDLSYNRLSGFPVGFSFAKFGHLRTLFLHYNRFVAIKGVADVGECGMLEYLTLFGNPLEQTKTRHYFINRIPSLKLMDDKIITTEQRNPQLLLRAPLRQPEKLTFPIVTILKEEGSASFLAAVVAELRIIREKYKEANPIVRAQRWWRRVLGERRKRQQRKLGDIMADVPIVMEIQPVTARTPKKQQHKQRLITEKLAIYNSSQQKILSLLQMNVEFMSLLRQWSNKKVFALRSFCQSAGLRYEETTSKMFCLRAPSCQEEGDVKGRKCLPFVMACSQKYLLRRRGSQLAMNMPNRYKILNTLLKKKLKRQPSYQKTLESTHPNIPLLGKLTDLECTYSDRLVLVTQPPATLYTSMKQSYHRSLSLKKIFPFLLEQLLERSAAAVSIQRMWRGYTVRKSHGNGYEKIVRNLAAGLLQRCVRNLAYRKRGVMGIELRDYWRKEEGNQIVVKMQDVMGLERRAREIEDGINFVLKEQKIGFGFQGRSQRIGVVGSLCTNLSRDIKILTINSSQNQGNLSILDILFKGAKNVRYLQTVAKAQLGEVQQPSLVASKSITTLGKSGVVVIKNNLNSPKAQQKKQKPTFSSIKNVSKLVLIEYQSSQQATNRKFLIALLTYKLLSNTFVRSLKLNLKQNCNLKNITQQVNQSFLVTKMDQEEKKNEQIKTQLDKRQKLTGVKVKFFTQQYDHTVKLQIYLPLSLSHKGPKKQHSMSLPLRNISYTSIGDKSSVIGQKQHHHPIHLANISRNVISMYPNQRESEIYEKKSITYREGGHTYMKKLKQRYEDLESVDGKKERSLQKSQSMQPPSKNQTAISGAGYFPILNQNLEKSYATEVHNESVTESLRDRVIKNDNSLGYYSIQDENLLKKKKINFLKDTHRQKLQQNTRYKKQQLHKLREKYSDEQQQNSKIMESNRLEGVLANARRHNMVKKALQSKLEDIKTFQKDFLKRGNSSIRRDMIKFEHNRSTKSPDNESIYQSLKSLQSEAIKHHLAKRSKNIFNLKTQIKQFSIDGSEGEADMSLGVLQIQSRSKELRKRQCEQQAESTQVDSSQKQIIRRAKSNKKEIKKNKVVHSVFPQEFYPLKQSKKLGFQLPRINKN